MSEKKTATQPPGDDGIERLYRGYERQKCFLGYSQGAPWAPDLLAACSKVLERPEFDLDLDYAGKHFQPGVTLRQKAQELIANARYGIYDLSWWLDESGNWQMPRNVLIELGVAIALNRPTLLLRHASNRDLALPEILTGLASEPLEFSGETTLEQALEDRLPQWIDEPPEIAWWNRFCHFGRRRCDFREAHPQARQWAESKLRCDVHQGCDPDQTDFRAVVETVIDRFSQVEVGFADDLEVVPGFEFRLCTLCQRARSKPLAIYRISKHTTPETFIALGMNLGLEFHFGYSIPKILLSESHKQVPSLLQGYEVVEVRNDRERKERLKRFLPGVLKAVRSTAWNPRPLPFLEVPLVPDPEVPQFALGGLEGVGPDEVVEALVSSVAADTVEIEIGGRVFALPRDEFESPNGQLQNRAGETVRVLFEGYDSDGEARLSRRKVYLAEVWEHLQASYSRGTVVAGQVIDRIKGGLTVDVGVKAFVPGSLVDVRPVKHLETLEGEVLDFKVISLDRRRNNVVLSRKAVLEMDHEQKAKTLAKLEEGALLPGIVRVITDYGAFVDLGGIDGLLHVTDISWGRVNHPSEHFAVGDDIEVVVLKVDREKGRVSLGYKQRNEDPWTRVGSKYPVGTRVDARVVSLVDYGAFVELEEGVEGLIHVSEMSWARKDVNPAEVLTLGDRIELIVWDLDLEKRRMSLSLRQTEPNPWEELADTLPVGSIIEGKVRNLTDFGAFVAITDEIDGLIHVSDMTRGRTVQHPGEVLEKGEMVKARITAIDAQTQRVSLSIKEFLPSEWAEFASRHQVGDTVFGRIASVRDFGLLVDVYDGLEGLVHVSETPDPNRAPIQDQFQVSGWVSVRVQAIEEARRRISLTMRGVPQPKPRERKQLEADYQARLGTPRSS